MATALRDAEADWLDALDVSRRDHWAEGRAPELLARLRGLAPVHHCRHSAYGPYWSVTRHADISAVELRPGIFSSSHELGGITLFVDEHSPSEYRLPMFIASDGMVHRRQRGAIAPAFCPSQIGRLAEAVRARTETLVDALPVGETFDWADRVAVELTTQMLAVLFDFPWEQRRMLTAWSDLASEIDAVSDPERSRRRMKALRECANYFLRLRRERRSAERGPDLVSILMGPGGGDETPPQQFFGNLVVLIIGGNDTTRSTIAALPIVNRLFGEEWRAIAARPALIGNAVQELIRWQTPIAHMRRTATCDFELAGETIRAGEKVVMWYLSANRDEALFDDPERFVADRPNARRHLGFGAGVHRCVGARLAHLQVATLLEVLLERGLMPVAAGEPERVPSSFVHGYRRLPAQLVRFGG